MSNYMPEKEKDTAGLISYWADGTIRIKDSHLLIDKVVAAYDQGRTPEQFVDSFPSEHYTADDIAAVFDHYVENRSSIDQYITERQEKANSILRSIRSDPKFKDRFDGSDTKD